jgi:hypothetical protein
MSTEDLEERTEGEQSDEFVRIPLPADPWFTTAREAFDAGDYGRAHAAATIAQALDHRAMLAQQSQTIQIMRALMAPVDASQDTTP